MIQRRFVGSGMTLGFALAALVVIGSSVLIHRNIQLIAHNEDQVVHTHQVLTALTEVRAALNVAESSQRGYLITADPAYLVPYQQVVPTVVDQLKAIQELTQDNDAQVRNFVPLATSVRQRLETLGEGIGIVQNSGRDAGRDFILQGRGAKQMEEVRENLERMIKVEERLL